MRRNLHNWSSRVTAALMAAMLLLSMNFGCAALAAAPDAGPETEGQMHRSTQPCTHLTGDCEHCAQTGVKAVRGGDVPLTAAPNPTFTPLAAMGTRVPLPSPQPLMLAANYRPPSIPTPIDQKTVLLN